MSREGREPVDPPSGLGFGVGPGRAPRQPTGGLRHDRGMPTFTCAACGRAFEVPQAALDKYPGWTPRACRACKDAAAVAKGGAAPAPPRRSSATATEVLTPAQVLERYHEGPQDGLFTDGGAQPNPG